MNDIEKRIYDDMIETLTKHSGSKAWQLILEDEDGDYNIAIIDLVDILEQIIWYEEGREATSYNFIKVYLNCLNRANELLESIEWDKTNDSN